MGGARWPAVRAGLIGLVIFVQALDAIPLPEISRRDLRWPIAKAEVTRWTGLAQDLGMDVTEDDTEELALALGGGAGRFRKTVLGPTRPFRRITGTGQAWGLFAYPDPFAGRLIISGRTDDADFVELYRAPGQGEPWLVDLVEYRRIRGIYDDNGDRPRPGGTYKALTRWISRRVVERHPEFDEVEIRLDLVEVHLPGEDPEPPEARRHVRVERREELLP
jgi:hypothetical protein